MACTRTSSRPATLGVEAIAAEQPHHEGPFSLLLRATSVGPAAVFETYRRLGPGGFRELPGDFALVLWDRARGVVSLAVDALSNHSLVYRRSGASLQVSFAIETMLSAQPQLSWRKSRAALGRWLGLAHDDYRSSFYEGVFYLSPGHYAQWPQGPGETSRGDFAEGPLEETPRGDFSQGPLETLRWTTSQGPGRSPRGTTSQGPLEETPRWTTSQGPLDEAPRGTTSQGPLEETPYWTPPLGGLDRRHPRDEEEQFWYLLRRALQQRVPAGTQLGLSLSGGLDSGSLALALHQLGLPFTAYTNTFEQFPDCDERSYASLLVDHCRCPWRQVPSDFSFQPEAALERVARAVLPSFNFYQPIPEALRSAAARDGCQQLIAGYFGDALFATGRFWLYDAVRTADRPALRAISQLGPTWQAACRRELSYALGRHIPAHWRPSSSRPPGMTAQFFTAAQTPNPRGRTLHQHRCLTALCSAQLVRAVAAYPALSLIDPFRDRDLIEFVLRTPCSRIAIPGQSKSLLRRSVPSNAPSAWRWRRGKTDFSSLVMPTLRPFQSDLRRQLRQGTLVEQGILDPQWLSDPRDSESDLLYLWIWSCLERYYSAPFSSDSTSDTVSGR